MNACGCDRETGARCDFARDLERVVLQHEATCRRAESAYRYGGPAPFQEREAVVTARNNLLAHLHEDIPPEEADTFCDCCGARGVQHPPYDANTAFGSR